MKIERFEDILSWQKSKELNIKISHLFKDCKNYSFKDQILRCSLSIMNNIAEGFERKSNKEFSNFLFIAKGSCGELRSMLYLALDFCYIKEDEFKNIYNKSVEISKLLSGLIKTL